MVETNVSDFQKLIVTLMKLYSPKPTPNLVTYRKYNNFDKGKFINEISLNLQKHNLQKLIIFEKHASLKWK